MAKQNLTDRALRALKPAAPGKRYDVMDAIVPGLGVRVTDKGHRTFILATRFPGKPNYTRRELGQYGEFGLEAARTKARRWIELIGEGKDPAGEDARIERENRLRQANSFAAVAEDYIRHIVIGPDPDRPKQRKGPEVERTIRRVLMPLWGERPITDIARRDVLAVIEGVRDHGTDAMLAANGAKAGDKRTRKRSRKGAPGQARNILGYLKTLFSWAIEREVYGLEASPCDHIRAARLIGEKASGDRILSDDEVGAFWRATGRMGYPYGPLYRLLLLTGVRLNEAADATRPELEIKQKLWTIPASRMKGKDGKVRPHVVPLNSDMSAIFESLPRFRNGDHLFSTTFGRKPVWVNDKVKKRLDRRMLWMLRALARKRGDDPNKAMLARWINHDLRRTVRSGLTKLRVDSDVAEAVLAHVKSGIRGVYDRYDLLDEKRHALELWAAHVRSIVALAPENVVPLRAQA